MLEEQISAGKQNSEHYQNRMNTLQDEISRRKDETAKRKEERDELLSAKKEIRSRLEREEKHLETILAGVEECSRAVEDGKNEIIELSTAALQPREKPSVLIR